jgi:hypothetical protein
MTDKVKHGVETFMADYFQAKVDLEKRQLEIRAPYRKQFYSDDCVFDSHKGTLAWLQSERILDIQEDAAQVRVITRQITHRTNGATQWVLRYHLQPFNNKWHIHMVDRACLACDGRDTNCILCKGVYWVAFA